MFLRSTLVSLLVGTAPPCPIVRHNAPGLCASGEATESMSYRELQQACKARGLSARGKAEILRQQLAAMLAQPGAGTMEPPAPVKKAFEGAAPERVPSSPSLPAEDAGWMPTEMPAEAAEEDLMAAGLGMVDAFLEEDGLIAGTAELGGDDPAAWGTTGAAIDGGGAVMGLADGAGEEGATPASAEYSDLLDGFLDDDIDSSDTGWLDELLGESFDAPSGGAAADGEGGERRRADVEGGVVRRSPWSGGDGRGRMPSADKEMAGPEGMRRAILQHARNGEHDKATNAIQRRIGGSA